MKQILFVCHGNICRSPMAEFVMRDMVEKAGLGGDVAVASAATSRDELGNPVYPPAREMLKRHGLDPGGKKARQLTKEDYDKFNLLVCMDSANMENMQRLFGGDPQGKLLRLLDLSDHPRNLADPWYTGDFQITWEDVNEGCQLLLEQLKGEK